MGAPFLHPVRQKTLGYMFFLYFFLMSLHWFQKKYVTLWRLHRIMSLDRKHGGGGAIHNIKASLTLCLLSALNVGNSKLMAKGMVRGECYGYVITLSGVCRGQYYALLHAFRVRVTTYGVGIHIYLFAIIGFLRPKAESKWRCESTLFCCVLSNKTFFIAL